VIDVQYDVVQALMALDRERAHPVSPHLRKVRRINRLAGHATGLNARFE
jgi:hypothetical protein